MSDEMKDELAMQKRLDRVGNILIVLSGKGGVGKSTVAVNLALALAKQGLRTGILDVDIHGPSIPKLLNLQGKVPIVTNEGITPVECYGGLKAMSMGFLLQGTEQAVIWRGPMKANVIKEFLQSVDWGDLDYLVVDCPPGTGDEPLSVAQLLSGRGSAVIVTTPQQVATIDVEKCITFCRQLNLPMAGIVENMSGFVCPHCGNEVNIFSAGGGEELAMKFGIPFLGRIPLDPEVVKSGDEEKPFILFNGKTTTAQRFEEIVTTLLNSPQSSMRHLENTIEKIENKQQPLRCTMKFAVPTNDGKLCAHFGHCQAFAIIDTAENGTILGEDLLPAPEHEPGLLPGWLSQRGVNCVIAGGMGSRAQQLFAEKGVKVVTGAQGETPRQIVENYLKGQLLTGANVCDH